MHHAIMNVLGPIFDRQQVYHSYACRKGKGTHAAVLYAFDRSKRYPRFVKLDVRKYFDSIDHDVLKERLRRIIKDDRTSFLLDGIIDSYERSAGRGLPIGNLTSQFFANHYLSSHDHQVIEREGVWSYVRYMDDIVMWTESASECRRLANTSQEYCSTMLRVALKEPVSGRSADGLPFLGFLVKPHGIYLTAKSKRRLRRRAREVQADVDLGTITESQAAQRANGINAAVLIARSRRFRGTVWHGADFGHEPGQTGRQLEQQQW